MNYLAYITEDLRRLEWKDDEGTNDIQVGKEVIVYEYRIEFNRKESWGDHYTPPEDMSTGYKKVVSAHVVDDMGKTIWEADSEDLRGLIEVYQ